MVGAVTEKTGKATPPARARRRPPPPTRDRSGNRQPMKKGEGLAQFLARLPDVKPSVARTILVAGLLAYGWALSNVIWLSDDFFISLRQVEQFFGGNGLRFNVHERSNVFSSTLNMFNQVLLRVFVKDPFVLFGLFALAWNAITLWVLWRLAAGHAWRWLLAVLALIACKPVMDFAWSGLENPMGYAFAATAALLWLRLHPRLKGMRWQDDAAQTRWHWWLLMLLGGLAPLYRHDFVLLAWPLVGWAWFMARRHLPGRTLVGAAALVGGPLAAWMLFSLAYYGFALPAPAYIKLGGASGDTLTIGLNYMALQLRLDFLTPLIMLVVPLALLATRRPAGMVPAIALGLVWLYILFGGGDYMIGRFMAVPVVFCVALALGTTRIWWRTGQRRLGLNARHPLLAGIVLVGWLVAWPHSAYHDNDVAEQSAEYTIFDERANWQPITGLAQWHRHRSSDGQVPFPDNFTTHLGMLLSRENPGEPVFDCQLGLSAYNGPLDLVVVDIFGLGDTYLGRMPVSKVRPGHKRRAPPQGYLSSMVTGTNAIRHEGLREFHAAMRLATAGEPLFSAARLKAIAMLNLGLLDDLVPQYDKDYRSWVESQFIWPNFDTVPSMRTLFSQEVWHLQPRFNEPALCLIAKSAPGRVLMRELALGGAPGE